MEVLIVAGFFITLPFAYRNVKDRITEWVVLHAERLDAE